MSLFTMNEGYGYNDIYSLEESRVTDALKSFKEKVVYLFKRSNEMMTVSQTGVVNNATKQDVEKTANDIERDIKTIENSNEVSREDLTALERFKKRLEDKLEKWDKEIKELKFKDEGIGTKVVNAIKWAFIQLKRIFTKILKLLVSAISAIYNKIRGVD
nr:MAG TPA: hypothetical protein [Caudoviricetes sp.]